MVRSLFSLPRARSTTASKLSVPQTVFASVLPLAVHAYGAALFAPVLPLAVHADPAAAALSANLLVPPVRANGTAAALSTDALVPPVVGVPSRY
jgi:hypothetical protein